ncbi:CcdB family protein [Poseidonibacter lekithochrous]|uniref:CcdB family protein n=1 Tax=Poseidonibacter lekithochrous TaxID=1904463 RepID=UPI0008FC7E96|nr:CcdB family protein [Poseidonibacter lekithochrous]QKJ23232.1 plasmid maintenance protein CcdB [Poseidonibacter lekithochrous]
MAQFDVYKNGNPRTNKKVPYLIDVQSDILKHLNTRVVVPLSRDKKIFNGLIKELNVNDEKVYLITSQIGTALVNELNEKVCSLDNQKEDIKNSIDFLIYGY